jgi:hypothetical protein
LRFKRRKKSVVARTLSAGNKLHIRTSKNSFDNGKYEKRSFLVYFYLTKTRNLLDYKADGEFLVIPYTDKSRKNENKNNYYSICFSSNFSLFL